MNLIIICLVAFSASFLTFFSGFGLGTLLLPAFVLFFPPEQAISFTAVVHFSNNLFKSALVFRFADWKIVFRFGVFSIPAAILGAYLLKSFSNAPPIYHYTLSEKYFCQIDWSGIVVGTLMIFFAFYEFRSFNDKKQQETNNRSLWAGGLISGFFGGLTGHQGAMRSAWLIRIINDKNVFIATGVMIAFLVDISRLLVYSDTFRELNFNTLWSYLFFPILFALSGAVIGNYWLKKITIKSVKNTVMFLLFFIGILTILGLLHPKIQ